MQKHPKKVLLVNVNFRKKLSNFKNISVSAQADPKQVQTATTSKTVTIPHFFKSLHNKLSQFLNLGIPAMAQKEILFYLNLSRENPHKFSQYVKEELDKFHSDGYTLPLVPGFSSSIPEMSSNYSTNQGKSAWIECINFLQKATPLPPLKLSNSLSLVAQSHADDMSKNNFMSHNGSDGSSLEKRISKFCQKPSGYGVFACGENIGGDFNYEGRNKALNSIKSLLIDDGVLNRGHRSNILSTTYQFVGIGASIVGKKFRTVLVFYSHDPLLKDNSEPKKQNTIPKAPQNTKEKLQKNFGIGKKQMWNEDPQFMKAGMRGFNFNDMSNFQNTTANNQSTKAFGGRYVVSKKKSSSTSTKNGKTVKKSVQTLTYSDGTVQTNQSIEEI